MKGIKKVKTAVIGCGAISRIYFENMTNAFEILEVAGCCDLNQQLAEDTAAAYDIPVLTMEEILEDSGIEIVVNLTNPAAHYGVIRNLLEHGKHVYTEKVLAATFGRGKGKTAVQRPGYIPGSSRADCQVSGGIGRDWNRDLLCGGSAKGCQASG